MAVEANFHISHPRLDGPAERTAVQPWLTELTHATMNAYAEPPRALAAVETLPVRDARRPAVRAAVVAA
ncbi:hypothetical protein [Actinomadura sp. WMMB 499]|uniref:hypothetical protein n=1 Tax=Actinomadura sp. WMMB 499 TaxID=1219491 RepID=UPI0012470CE8|nr:hypothetical protein [Actinomadura sp. WMMB 499]QFG21215.1 hypothetical protein F7P10_08740 [Actinomadura sp. WMMB 499]